MRLLFPARLFWRRILHSPEHTLSWWRALVALICLTGFSQRGAASRQSKALCESSPLALQVTVLFDLGQLYFKWSTPPILHERMDFVWELFYKMSWSVEYLSRLSDFPLPKHLVLLSLINMKPEGAQVQTRLYFMSLMCINNKTNLTHRNIWSSAPFMLNPFLDIQGDARSVNW